MDNYRQGAGVEYNPKNPDKMKLLLIDNQYEVPFCQDLPVTTVMKFRTLRTKIFCQDFKYFKFNELKIFCQDLSGFKIISYLCNPFLKKGRKGCPAATINNPPASAVITGTCAELGSVHKKQKQWEKQQKPRSPKQKPATQKLQNQPILR
jgi:hypothetical protein